MGFWMGFAQGAMGGLLEEQDRNKDKADFIYKEQWKTLQEDLRNYKKNQADMTNAARLVEPLRAQYGNKVADYLISTRPQSIDEVHAALERLDLKAMQTDTQPVSAEGAISNTQKLMQKASGQPVGLGAPTTEAPAVEAPEAVPAAQPEHWSQTAHNILTGAPNQERIMDNARKDFAAATGASPEAMEYLKTGVMPQREVDYNGLKFKDTEVVGQAAILQQALASGRLKNADQAAEVFQQYQKTRDPSVLLNFVPQWLSKQDEMEFNRKTQIMVAESRTATTGTPNTISEKIIQLRDALRTAPTPESKKALQEDLDYYEGLYKKGDWMQQMLMGGGIGMPNSDAARQAVDPNKSETPNIPSAAIEELKKDPSPEAKAEFEAAFNLPKGSADKYL